MPTHPLIDWQFRREIPNDYIAKSISSFTQEEALCLDLSPGWREPILAYLKDETLPSDKAEAQKLQHLVTRYTVLNNKLYIKFYSNLRSHTDSLGVWGLKAKIGDFPRAINSKSPKKLHHLVMIGGK